MHEKNLTPELWIMILVMPLAFFATKGALSESTGWSLQYYFTCLFSIGLGILLASRVSGFLLRRLRKGRRFLALACAITFCLGILLVVITIELVEPYVSFFGASEFVIGFYIAAWILLTGSSPITGNQVPPHTN
ncbi:hypothetical protein [Aliidiomarina maris]|uniref:Uncharacterized protein n=1 Tax=Aliidiomarina maris TaxID=531312 RepID=A0A327WQL4_9GAMM|nr:hypothetical protein [Aliidiomarina maris]RAJ94648.1 hypothetical protein B0I24_11452 [Aliidiomarina maris]RUO19743.1 hypothetical protein CWE07_12800 [Aliidiomarina maris]